MTRRVVEKQCTKKICVDFWAPISTQNLVRQGAAAYSNPKCQASSELWAPLACILLRAAWQSLAERVPTQLAARPPDSHYPARPVNDWAALKRTNLRGQTEPKRGFSQILADFR